MHCCVLKAHLVPRTALRNYRFCMAGMRFLHGFASWHKSMKFILKIAMNASLSDALSSQIDRASRRPRSPPRTAVGALDGAMGEKTGRWPVFAFRASRNTRRQEQGTACG